MKLDTNINYEGRGKERENLKNLLHFSLNLAWKKRKKERKEGRKVFESPVSEGNKHGGYPRLGKRKGRKVATGANNGNKETRATELANCPGWRW